MAQTGVVSWSQTAATNATADSNVNWAEGMAPSQVNDSARAQMASVAKWRDDNAGTLLSTGSGTAHTVSSNQSFSSLTVLDGQTIRVRFGFTNGAAPTLSVDGLAAKPIQVDAVTAIAQGAIRANTIHGLTYDNSLGAFIVHHGHSLVEPGRISAHAATSAPAGWLLCDGTGVSRTTYADLFAIISTTYGSSDGASFKTPDMRDKVPAGKGSGSILSFSGSLGSTGGAATVTLSSTEMPTHTHIATDSGHTHRLDGKQVSSTSGNGNYIANDSGFASLRSATTTDISFSQSVVSGTANITNANAGSGSAHSNVQPTLIVNFVIKT